MIFELCTDSLESVHYASKRGFSRVELCSALELGGLTPSIGLIEQASKVSHIEIHPIIRPRAGDFQYSQEEFLAMKLDIENAAKAGATGVVFGILTADFEIDLERNGILKNIASSNGLESTYHRAFDFVKDPFRGIDQLIELGIDRILSSGQKATAIEGIECLREMCAYAKNGIQIMAGSGVNGENAQALANSGVHALHFTARKRKSSHSPLNMGPEYEIDDEKVDQIFNVL